MSNKEKKLRSYLEFAPHKRNGTCLGVGRKSHLFATGGRDHKTLIWTIHHLRQTGKPYKPYKDHTSPVTALTFNPNEDLIASGSSEGVVRMWSINDDTVNKSFPEPHSGAVTTLCFSNDSVFLASGSADSQVKLYDTTQFQCMYTFKHHSGPIRCLAFSPDSRWLFTGSDDGTCAVVDLNDCSVKHTFTHTGGVTCLTVHPSDLVLATGGVDKVARVWDLLKFTLISETPADASPILALQFCDQYGDCLAVASETSLKLYHWDNEDESSTAKLLDKLDANWVDPSPPSGPFVPPPIDMVIDEKHILACTIRGGQVTMWLIPLVNVQPFRRRLLAMAKSTKEASTKEASTKESSTKESSTKESSTKEAKKATTGEEETSTQHADTSSEKSLSKPSVRAMRGQERIYQESTDSPFYHGPDPAPLDKQSSRGRGAAAPPAEPATPHKKTEQADPELSSTAGRRSLKSKLGQSMRDPWGINGRIDLSDEPAVATPQQKQRSGKAGEKEGEDDDDAAVVGAEDAHAQQTQIDGDDEESSDEPQPIPTSSGAHARSPSPDPIERLTRAASPPPPPPGPLRHRSNSPPQALPTVSDLMVTSVRSDKEVLENVRAKEQRMVSTLSSRLSSLKAVGKVMEMADKDLLNVCECIARINDITVTHDCLRIFTLRHVEADAQPAAQPQRGFLAVAERKKPREWCLLERMSLNSAIVLLPLLVSQISSGFDVHVTVALDVISSLASSFGQYIQTTCRARRAVGVDLTGDERREKCRVANKLFAHCTEKIKTIIAKRGKKHGDPVAIQAKEVKRLLDTFVTYA